MHAEACLGLPVLPVKQTGHLNVPPIPSKLCSIRWHRSFAGESNIWLHSLHSWLMPSSARFKWYNLLVTQQISVGDAAAVGKKCPCQHAWLQGPVDAARLRSRQQSTTVQPTCTQGPPSELSPTHHNLHTCFQAQDSPVLLHLTPTTIGEHHCCGCRWVNSQTAFKINLRVNSTTNTECGLKCHPCLRLHYKHAGKGETVGE